MRFMYLVWVFMLALLTVVRPQDTSHSRSYFYVGGSYYEDEPGRRFHFQQMYVERLAPAAGITQINPVVLIHGYALTGTSFLNKPDGGRGWASLFLEQGYEIYVVDLPLRGRSPWNTTDGPLACVSADFIMQYQTAIERYNLWPQAALHAQWPGNGSIGDPIFDAYFRSLVQASADEAQQQRTAQKAVAELLDKIGKPAILIGHSQGGPIPLLAADIRPEGVRSIVLLEPSGPPFEEAGYASKIWGITTIPMTYSPPVTDPVAELVKQKFAAPAENKIPCTRQAESPIPRKLLNLVDMPILLVTSEASLSAMSDYCTVEWLRQAGCTKTEHLELDRVGVHGNGHMFFMENNSDAIQRLVEEWMAST